MPPSDKFSLRWNDFQDHINNAFTALRKDSDFTDVTLVSEDGNKVYAHQVILAASSPFFQNLLRNNKHAHPLICMTEVKFEDLLAIIDLLYYGETNINQDNIDTFLNIAEELKLEGLNGAEKSSGEEGGVGKNLSKQNAMITLLNTGEKEETGAFKNEIASQNNTNTCQLYQQDQILYSTDVVLTKHEFSGDMFELDKKIKSMMDKGENMIKHGAKKMEKCYVCKVCGKEGQKPVIKGHIEANHLEGISIPCNLCDKTLR